MRYENTFLPLVLVEEPILLILNFFGSDFFGCPLQVFASCFAGVYNEYLLKSHGSVAVPLMLQNVFMYVDSIIANVGALAVSGSLVSAVSPSNLHALLNWKVRD